MKPLDLNLLTALDALLSTGSVTLAAQRLHLSAPAMSHTLARIREALGDPVLVRAGRRLLPTPRAIEMREAVSRVVAEAQGLMRPTAGLQLAQVQREFIVRAPDGFSIVHGAGLLAALRQTLPQVTLRFVPESDSDSLALREGRIDLDIGAVHDRGPEILTSVLGQQRIVGAVHRSHPLLDGAITLPRFAAEQHVAIAQRGQVHERVDVAMADAGAARQIVLAVPSTYGALMAAAQSTLVASVPEPITRGVAEGLELVMFELPLPPLAEQVVLAWHPRVDADAAHQCLRRCVTGRTAAAPSAAGTVLRNPARQRALLALAKAARPGRPDTPG